MEILLRPAQEVPGIFNDKLRQRHPGEAALATTFSIDFEANPVLEDLVKYGTLGDVVAPDYLGHVHGSSMSWLRSKDHETARREFQEAFSGTYNPLGKPEDGTRFPLSHRSHIKALTVGSKALSLGGVNLTNYSYNNCVDAMLEFDSPEFADLVALLLEEDGDFREFDGPGGSLDLSQDNKVLIDWGKDGQSLIMYKVFSDLQEKDIVSVTMSSSFIPAGFMYSSLWRIAEAGGQVAVYANSLTKFNRPHQSMLERRMRREDLVFKAMGDLASRRISVPIIDYLPKGKFNHLKTLIINKRDESRVAYIGSHNFYPVSVSFGTAEVALRTTDDKVIDQIEAFISNNLAPAKDRSKRDYLRCGML